MGIDEALVESEREPARTWAGTERSTLVEDLDTNMRMVGLLHATRWEVAV